MLKDDLSLTYRRMKGSYFTKVVKLCMTPGVRAVVIFRFGGWLLSKSKWVRLFLKPVQLILHRRMMSKWGIEINTGAKIGGGLRIAHYGGIFVGDDVVIGQNCLLSHDVTIGLAGSGNRRGAPVIGNNVYIAPGAKIVGRIKIGDNAQIGTNAFVNRDVPENALVQVRPPQVVVFPSYGTRQISTRSVNKEDNEHNGQEEDQFD